MEPTTGQVASQDGTLIRYSVTGEGPPLLLIHGTSLDRQHWDDVSPFLNPNYSVYAVDRRGRGDSGDAAGYTIDKEYEDVAALVDYVAEPVNLLGHSYGGLICLEAALLTDNIRRLVLYEPTFGKDLYPAGLRERLEELIAQGDYDATLATFFTDAMGLPSERLEQMRAEPDWDRRLSVAPTLARELADEDYEFDPQRFIDLQTPTLLLMGSESPHEFKASTAAVHDALPNSQLAVIPNQGHLATRRAPELFARLVTEFL